MFKKSKENIDYETISQRYRTNVKKLISAWKKGYSDMEVSEMTGLDVSLLQQIKNELEMAHRQQRMERKKNMH